MDYSNYNNNTTEGFYSWPIILLALYFFFPLGIFMIIKKSRIHRRNIFTVGQKTFSSAISLFIFGFVLYIPKILLKIAEVSSTNEVDAEFVSIVNSDFYSKVLNIGNWFFILGFIVLIISFYQKYKGEKYRNYISIIVNKETENLDEIAKKMNLGKYKVIQDIKVLIKRRYLPDTYELDLEENRVYDVPKDKRKKEEKEKEKEKNTRVVKCSNCYANNKLVEKIGRCEYCNSYIE